MKKMLIILSVVLSLALAGNVMAKGFPIGNLDVHAVAKDCVIDGAHIHTIDGGAFGISGGVGFGFADANGFIINGTISGDVTAIGGALTKTKVFKSIQKIENGKLLRIGSSSSSIAQGGGSVMITADGGKFIAIGGVKGHLFGFAVQGTLNGSTLGDGPMLRSDGRTSGLAGQGSVGLVEGSVGALSGPDGFRPTGVLWKKLHGRHAGELFEKPFSWHPRQPSEWERVGFSYPDSIAGAGVDGTFYMEGNSYSESYRSFSEKDGVRTEQMGTFVGATTLVNTTGFEYSYQNVLGVACVELNGGWKAGGMVSTQTIQTLGSGVAQASARGSYSGAGQLGTNYQGSAQGYSGTSITTINGMKGTLVSSQAGMSVTSKISVPQLDGPN